jgi:6-phosphofructokinase 1
LLLNAGIGAGAEKYYTRRKLGLDRLLESLKSKASGKSSSIVVIAEGDKIGKTYSS